MYEIVYDPSCPVELVTSRGCRRESCRGVPGWRGERSGAPLGCAPACCTVRFGASAGMRAACPPAKGHLASFTLVVNCQLGATINSAHFADVCRGPLAEGPKSA